MNKVYDMIVVGGGPAGYTAALYAARAELSVLIIEKISIGGQISLTHQVDNYPGFEEGIDGFSLGYKMHQQAERFGAETMMTEVTAVELKDEIKKVETTDGTFYGKTVVLATGASPKEMGVEGEKEMIGKGISYCATCDAMFYRGKTVVIVGGGNTAAADAIVLARVCEKVYLVHRRDSLRASRIYHEQLKNIDNVEFVWNSTVEELLHDQKITGVKTKNKLTGEEREIACDGVFVAIGRQPATELVKGQIELDQAGYVPADETTRTNIPGVFAAGDVRAKELRQVVTAVADGAVAAYYADEYLTGGIQ